MTDLGKDIDNEAIILKAGEINADIVGLSALMTTTMPKMKEFMELKNKTGGKFKVMVGGAAVTRSYAESIGASFSADAVEAVRVAKALVKND